MNKLLMLCAALVLMSTQAQALCRDDIKNMKPRIERIKNSEPQRYYTGASNGGDAPSRPSPAANWNAATSSSVRRRR